MARAPFTPAHALRIRDALMNEWVANGETVPSGTEGQWEHSLGILWRNDLWKAALNRCEALVGTSLPPAVASCAPQLWFTVDATPEMETPEILQALKVEPPATLLAWWVMPGYLDGPGVKSGLLYASQQPDQLTQIEVRSQAWQPLTEPVHVDFAPFAAGLCFLDMEWVGRERVKPSRQVLRAAARKEKPIGEVYTIHLRRPMPSGDARTEPGEPREWSCSWIVSGHWRKQLCRSKSDAREYEYRAVYVRPYAKGDPEKPLREPKGTIYVVNR